MSKLTLDEAIKHCLEVAEQKERDSAELIDILDEQDVTACKECAADHRQLAEWLKELKELEAKHWDECRQIAHYDNEIKELEAADVQPVKRGHWIEVTPRHSKCSICDTTCLIAVYPISKNANYCPNCGARMDGDAE